MESVFKHVRSDSFAICFIAMVLLNSGTIIIVFENRSRIPLDVAPHTA